MPLQRRLNLLLVLAALIGALAAVSSAVGSSSASSSSVSSASSSSGETNIAGDGRSSTHDVFFSAPIRPTTDAPGVQVAIHNALSVAVNGREYTAGGEAGGGESQELRYRPEPPRVRVQAGSEQRVGGSVHGSDDDEDEGYERSSDEANARLQPLHRLVKGNGEVAAAVAQEEEEQGELRRLLTPTITAALRALEQQRYSDRATSAPLAAFPSQSPPSAASVPLTLVDHNNRVVARGVFQQQQNGECAEGGYTAQPAATTQLGEGAVGRAAAERGAVEQLLSLLTAAAAQGSGVAGGVLTDGGVGGAGSRGGVEIALTDAAGRVVGVGTYFPHSPSRAALAQQQPPQQTSEPLPTAASDAPTRPPPQASRRSGVASAIPECYGNEYDSQYCRLPPHSDEHSSKHRRWAPDTQFLPASAPVYTTDEQATVARSRMPHYPAAPRLVVLEPQHTTEYANADITQSLATSLAVFPPVAPFMARPRSGVAEVTRQASEATAPAGAAPAAAAAEETEGADATEEAALGTQYRAQA